MTYELIIGRENVESLSEDFKKYVVGMDSPFVFLQDGIPIAKGELDIFEDNNIEIKLLEAVKKRNGAGRTFVEYLKNKPEVHEIWGESIPDAVGFWFKMGVTFDPSSFEMYLEAEEYDEGFLIPFTIIC